MYKETCYSAQSVFHRNLNGICLLGEAREQLGGWAPLTGQEGGKEQFPVTCSVLSSILPRVLTLSLRVAYLVLIFTDEAARAQRR